MLRLKEENIETVTMRREVTDKLGDLLIKTAEQFIEVAYAAERCEYYLEDPEVRETYITICKMMKGAGANMATLPYETHTVTTMVEE